jgi:hypothetical protein
MRASTFARGRPDSQTPQARALWNFARRRFAPPPMHRPWVELMAPRDAPDWAASFSYQWAYPDEKRGPARKSSHRAAQMADLKMPNRDEPRFDARNTPRSRTAVMGRLSALVGYPTLSSHFNHAAKCKSRKTMADPRDSIQNL